MVAVFTVVATLWALEAGTFAWAGGDIMPPFPQYAGDLKRQEATAMAVDLSGNVIVTGYQNLAGDTNDDFYTVKFKADGSGLAWSARVLDFAGGTVVHMSAGVAALAAAVRPSQVLDVGCGDGALLAHLRDDGHEGIAAEQALQVAVFRLLVRVGRFVGELAPEEVQHGPRQCDVVCREHTNVDRFWSGGRTHRP